MRFLVTGTAGFIGFHLARRLLADGHDVTGYDAVTDYYDVSLKRTRLALLGEHARFTPIEARLEDAETLTSALANAQADIVVHLAAQAGVRYSIEHPQSYVQSNLVGTANLLEALRQHPPRHLIFASTSSVYGGNTQMPFAETDAADQPVSLYAATKKAGEAMVHAHAHLWQLPSTCVRFFTVYGPWGRPDMALFKFVEAMLAGRPIDVYGHGKMQRDFSFVDDVVDALIRIGARPPVMGEKLPHDSLSGVAPFRSLNVAAGEPLELIDFMRAVERATGMSAQLNMLPVQPGDVVATQSDTRLLTELIGPMHHTQVEDGVGRFVEWYRGHYQK
ncbi:NAD-dependent epimerase/dehydratase family protein [Devosia naphthalenivorans]|uniref:NAD-dependent epimerase/dehydratase family protein n=1 Tax=Devosia naphthalenivorans TaxID=2082392 RepID=UPI000D3AA378|nr:NAD-dependent epimerase/dehydratase family protein [Devosia naphthalenivorans]